MSKILVKLSFSDNQIRKMKSSMKKKQPVNIQLKNNQIFDAMGTEVSVSEKQYKKLKSAKNSKMNRGVVMTFSPDMIGGILPFILPTLLTGVLSGAASYGVSKGLDAVVGGGKGNCCEMCGSGLTLPGSGLTLPGTKQKGRGRPKKKNT